MTNRQSNWKTTSTLFSLQTTLNPQAPVTFENPSYPNTAIGAMGGGHAPAETKKELPYNPAYYQPGYNAEALPPKDGIPSGMEPAYDEPPPAYTPNNPPTIPPDTKESPQ